ncbi:MAG: DUF3089 domain-containing protein [Sporomusaceae bacterium]|nr:DUF3089 domain-containing protein [Sporomusaceae bacterium]
MKQVKIFLAVCLVYFFLLGTVVYAQEQAVNYGDSKNWAYAPVENASADVDVFFIAPTVVLGGENQLNMRLDDPVSRRHFIGAINMEKGIYDQQANFYAPYYRQAALFAYKLAPMADSPCFDLAYQDVKTAFSYYLEHFNQGRPIVLAGFSQGGDMVLRLLKDVYQDKSLQSRLVAAYAIGWRVTAKEVATYPQLKMAQGERDTGVIISFNTEAESVKTSLLVPERTLGINPLNWTTTEAYADKTLNKGAVFTNYDGKVIKKTAHFTGAYLDKERGTLKVPDVNEADYPPMLDVFQPGVYHVYDYLFFYQNLQENVTQRINSFMANWKLKQVS